VSPIFEPMERLYATFYPR